MPNIELNPGAQNTTPTQGSNTFSTPTGNTIPSEQSPSVDGITITTPTDIPSAQNTSGMTIEELNDANKISVNIADTETPLVILFGPPACGKTMTLIRLARYLRSQGYTIRPVTSFRPSYDEHYKEMCESFDEMMSLEEAADSTSRINFMLVKVSKNGKSICQILEGPGEYYFHPESPSAPFPKYVNSIINSNNRKIWAIMLEPDHTNSRMGLSARSNYAAKIQRLKSKLNPQDKVIFLFNKIDETDFVIAPGLVKTELAMKEAADMYSGIFVAFSNANPITKFFKPYNFDFVAFHTGDYTKAADGTLMFTPGNDKYPEKLWEVFLKRIHG